MNEDACHRTTRHILIIIEQNGDLASRHPTSSRLHKLVQVVALKSLSISRPIRWDLFLIFGYLYWSYIFPNPNKKYSTAIRFTILILKSITTSLSHWHLPISPQQWNFLSPKFFTGGPLIQCRQNIDQLLIFIWNLFLLFYPIYPNTKCAPAPAYARLLQPNRCGKIEKTLPDLSGQFIVNLMLMVIDKSQSVCIDNEKYSKNWSQSWLKCVLDFSSTSSCLITTQNTSLGFWRLRAI